MIINNIRRNVRNGATYTEMNDTDVSAWLTAADTDTDGLKLSTVYACIDILSNDLGKIPFYVFDTVNKKRSDLGNVRWLLSTKPNRYMTPFIFGKLMMMNVLLSGNAFAYRLDDRRTGETQELIPLNPDDTEIIRQDGKLWYRYSGSLIEKGIYLPDELIHIKGFSRDGIHGRSVLSYAADTVSTASAQEKYSKQFFARGGRPQAILSTAADLQPKLDRDGNKQSPKELIRREWEKLNAGADNANRVAILDNGMEYKEVAQMSARDAMFVESKDLTVADIARFFRVPLYKLMTGKQSYSSNEQNDIEYVNSTIVPWLTQFEQTYTLSLLDAAAQRAMLSVKGNINVLLRGDIAGRANYYEKMRNIGAYSVNDILDLEDRPSVDGGDVRYASLNYVPLADFTRLSEARNVGNN